MNRPIAEQCYGAQATWRTVKGALCSNTRRPDRLGTVTKRSVDTHRYRATREAVPAVTGAQDGSMLFTSAVSLA